MAAKKPPHNHNAEASFYAMIQIFFAHQAAISL